jgi:ACS family hexuronate transporter-like MFS transporter
VGAMIGGIGGGWLSSRFLNKGWTVTKTRKFNILLGGLFMFPSLLTIIVLNNPSYAMVAIFFALFGFQIIIGTIQTMPSDYLSGKAVGTLSTWMVPALTKTSYTPFFILAATLVPLGIAVLFIFSGKIEKIKI